MGLIVNELNHDQDKYKSGKGGFGKIIILIKGNSAQFFLWAILNGKIVEGQ